MSVTGYLGKSIPELGMEKSEARDLGVVSHGPVLGGEKTVEEIQRLDAIQALRPGDERSIWDPLSEGTQKRVTHRSVEDYDPVLRGQCRL